MKTVLSMMVMFLFLGQGLAQKFINSHTVGNETKEYSKVLVIAKARTDTQRVEIEDDIVARLKKKDIHAVPSYLRVPGEMLKKKGNNEEAIENFVAKLREKGFDGILVSSMVDSEQSVEHNPASYKTRSVPVRYGRFGRYYGTARVRVYEPGTVEKHQNFVLESLLYDLRGSSKEDSLHWIGKIKVTDPASFDKASDKYAKTLVKRLTKEAIEGS